MPAVVWIVAVMGLLLAAGWLWERWSEAGAMRRHPAPGRRVDVGGRCLHLRESGEAAGPTVVIEQGAGGPAVFWWPAQDEIARFARVCTYDRPGTGWSDPAPGGRSMSDRVAELHYLLHAARVPGPYVLVGHSYGGPLISLFARDYPDETAGLVFADTPTWRACWDRVIDRSPERPTCPSSASWPSLRGSGSYGWPACWD
jgi:pimeloyl-ACP methyl ester carboxylesterase